MENYTNKGKKSFSVTMGFIIGLYKYVYIKCKPIHFIYVWNGIYLYVVVTTVC